MKQGWARAPLKELIEPRGVKIIPSSRPELRFIGMEHIEAQTTRIIGSVPAAEMKSAGAHFLPHDVLYGRLRPYLNKVARADYEGIASAEFIVLPDTEHLRSGFLQYRLNARDFVNFASSLNAGDRPRVDFDQISEFGIDLPPAREQARIVAKIEELLPDLNASVAALQRARANLKRYRAAVLKAAVEGKLTARWRKANPPSEPADKLLERILVERRKKWEDSQISKSRTAGVTLPKGWQKRYKAPAAHEQEFLPDIPSSWRWISLGTVAWQVRDGPHYSPQYSQEGVPFISGGNVRPDGIDLANAKHISKELHKELSLRCKPEYGDLLYTKGGTTGIARINTEEREFNVWVHVAVLKLVESIDKEYLQHTLNSPFCYSQSQRYTHGVGNQDLGLTRMIKIALPLPPLAEQHAMVEEMDRRLSLLTSLESELDVSLRRSTRLRQSILKRAFEGKLVPQDPDDEPASVLLERIRAARASDRSSDERSRTRKGNGEQRQRSGASTKPSKRGKQKALKQDLFAELAEGFDALKRNRDV